jgi:hypothetical protein
MCSDFLVTIVRSPLIEEFLVTNDRNLFPQCSTRAEIAGLSIAYLSPNHKMIDGCIRGKFFGAVLFSDITVAMIRISVMKRATSAVVNVFPEFGLPTITIRLGCGNGAAGFQSLS